MKRKINFVIVLMALCSIFLLGLQLYWNYQSYYNTTRVFKSDINDALDKSVKRLMDERRDAFVVQYKKWLADSSLIVISCRYSDTMKSTVFYIRDKNPPFSNRPPFSIGLNDFKKKRYNAITPKLKQEFINSFVKNILYRDLRSGSAYFYTERLGDGLVKAFSDDRLDKGRLTTLYKEELAERDIKNDFKFNFGIYKFSNYSTRDEGTKGESYSTRHFKYGFSSPMPSVAALFPNPNLVFLKKMKWVLISSMLLIGITIFCFTYTVKTMLSQHQLAILKDDFVNNMTHELKTPVATISIAAEAIQDFGVNKISADEYLSIIRHQAGNLTVLIDQILKSMVNEQAMLVLNMQKVDMRWLLLECVQQYNPQLQVSNAILKFDTLTGECYVNGDVVHLGNVIANLLDNAIKYGGENPVIGLDLAVRVNEVLIKFSNNGEGIPDTYHEKVFERFFRVPSGNLHNVKGYGLGLSYARDIVLRHGGNLRCESRDGLTTFILQLPLRTA